MPPDESKTALQNAKKPPQTDAPTGTFNRGSSFLAQNFRKNPHFLRSRDGSFNRAAHFAPPILSPPQKRYFEARVPLFELKTLFGVCVPPPRRRFEGVVLGWGPPPPPNTEEVFQLKKGTLASK